MSKDMLDPVVIPVTCSKHLLRSVFPERGYVLNAILLPSGILEPSRNLNYSPSNIQAFLVRRDSSLLLRIAIRSLIFTVFVPGSAINLQFLSRV
jgi:hypothetical protein